MTSNLICALGLGALMSNAPLYAADDPGIALPPVPRALLLAANETPATIRHVSAASSDNDTSEKGGTPATTLSLGPKTIRVAPGTTAIVEVAIDHLNRIVTPFSAPQVRTVSPATTQVDGKAKQTVLYDPDKCWGCGLCANTCTHEAIAMLALAP